MHAEAGPSACGRVHGRRVHDAEVLPGRVHSAQDVDKSLEDDKDRVDNEDQGQEATREKRVPAHGTAMSGSVSDSSARTSSKLKGTGNREQQTRLTQARTGRSIPGADIVDNVHRDWFPEGAREEEPQQEEGANQSAQSGLRKHKKCELVSLTSPEVPSAFPTCMQM